MTLTLTTWTDAARYRVTSAGIGRQYGPEHWHVRAVSEDGRQRLSFLINPAAYSRLPQLFEIGHVLAEGGVIL